MDKSELTRLKEMAERAEANDFGQITASYSNKAYAEFAAAADPQTVLALIAEIELLEKEADWLAKKASECAKCRCYEECPVSCEGKDSALSFREVARKAVEEQ